jgi:hypothetical protein
VETEYEHLLRLAVVPFVMRQPLIQRKAAAYAFVVRAAELAADIRHAQLGDVGASTGVPSLVQAAIKGGGGRLSKRWAVGAVPIAGVFYSSYDATRTIGRVLRLPFPGGDDPVAHLVTP